MLDLLLDSFFHEEDEKESFGFWHWLVTIFLAVGVGILAGGYIFKRQKRKELQKELDALNENYVSNVFHQKKKDLEDLEKSSIRDFIKHRK